MHFRVELVVAIQPLDLIIRSEIKLTALRDRDRADIFLCPHLVALWSKNNRFRPSSNAASNVAYTSYDTNLAPAEVFTEGGYGRLD